MSGEDAATRAAVAEKIERLWRKGGEFFFDGQFMDDVGVRSGNSGVFAKVYRSGSGIAVPLGNTTGSPLTAGLALDLKALGQTGASLIIVTSLENDNRVPCKAVGDAVTVPIGLRPHETVVLVLRMKAQGCVQ